MSARPPVDIKALAIALAVHLKVSEPEISRLRACDSAGLSLVMLRVAIQHAKLRGILSPADEDAMIESARIKPDLTSMMKALESPNQNNSTSSVTVADVVRTIDIMLVSPATRGRMPSWFVFELWPSVLRRLASGHAVNDREIMIARNLITEATDETE